ncbi:MAG: class B sortase [Oscillospiraceae bacterium]|nr:class B sortase [Oscillospiraceae bacterium]
MNTSNVRKIGRTLRRLLLQALVLTTIVFIGLAAWKFIAEKRETQNATTLQKPTQTTAASQGTETTAFVSPIDFTAQQREAKDTVAWLTIDAPQVKIDHPIVLGTDNQYYLTHSPTGASLKYGSVFMDFRCHADFSDFFTVLYAHHIKAKPDLMFAPLVRMKKKAVFDAVTRGMLYTPGKSYEMQIFGVSVIEAESEIYMKLAVFAPAEKKERIAALKKAAKHWREDIVIGNDDHIVMLSTCSYDEGDTFKMERTVVLCKLVEIGS